jgi:hypothetical protein
VVSTTSEKVEQIFDVFLCKKGEAMKKRILISLIGIVGLMAQPVFGLCGCRSKAVEPEVEVVAEEQEVVVEEAPEVTTQSKKSKKTSKNSQDDSRSRSPRRSRRMDRKRNKQQSAADLNEQIDALNLKITTMETALEEVAERMDDFEGFALPEVRQ